MYHWNANLRPKNELVDLNFMPLSYCYPNSVTVRREDEAKRIVLHINDCRGGYNGFEKEGKKF